jgi:hypothetical protein
MISVRPEGVIDKPSGRGSDISLADDLPHELDDLDDPWIGRPSAVGQIKIDCFKLKKRGSLNASPLL